MESSLVEQLTPSVSKTLFMKARLIATCLGMIGLGYGLWLLGFRPGDKEPPLASNVSMAASTLNQVSNATGTDVSLVTAPENKAALSPGASSSNKFTGNASQVLGIKELLTRPRYRPKMLETPAIDASTEAQLIRLYRQENSVTNKYRILRILVFRGSATSVPVFTNAILTEFAGRRTSPLEQAILIYLPEMMGILARHEDAALRFLIAGARPEYWRDKPAWLLASGEPREARMMAGACIKALALSGRSEGAELIQWYVDNPRYAGLQDVDGAVDEAIFTQSVIRERGLERAMDEVFFNPMTFMEHYREWAKTSEGRRSRTWMREAERLGMEARRGESNEP